MNKLRQQMLTLNVEDKPEWYNLDLNEFTGNG